MPRAMGRNQTIGVKSAMAKKRARKRQVWNKGLEVGKRDGLTPDQVKRIRDLLGDRAVPGLRDLALFSTAIDTMLHGQDLLALVVGDVQRRDGSIRPVIEVARARGVPPVRCALSKASTKALEKWITASGKKSTDYLFPGRGVEGRNPMGQGQLNRLLKLWVVEAGRGSELGNKFIEFVKSGSKQCCRRQRNDPSYDDVAGHVPTHRRNLAGGTHADNRSRNR